MLGIFRKFCDIGLMSGILPVGIFPSFLSTHFLSFEISYDVCQGFCGMCPSVSQFPYDLKGFFCSSVSDLNSWRHRNLTLRPAAATFVLTLGLDDTFLRLFHGSGDSHKTKRATNRRLQDEVNASLPVLPSGQPSAWDTAHLLDMMYQLCSLSAESSISPFCRGVGLSLEELPSVAYGIPIFHKKPERHEPTNDGRQDLPPLFDMRAGRDCADDRRVHTSTHEAPSRRRLVFELAR